MEPDPSFEIDNFIGREDEYNLFKQVLDQVCSWRVLAFQDKSGMGKTWLLRRLNSHCRKNNFPVCLISLAEQKTPIELVKAMRRQLDKSKLSFPTFDQCEDERNGLSQPAAAAAPAVRALPAEVRGEIHLDNADLSNAQHTQFVATQIIVNMTATPGLQQQAVERSLRAFLDDLRQVGASLKLAILLDDYEQGNSDTNAWLFDQLLPRVFFDPDWPSPHICLVTAGEEVPPYKDNLSDSLFEQVVQVRKPLSRWTGDHMRQYLAKQGQVDDARLTMLETFISRGMSLRWVHGVMSDLAAGRG